MTYWGLQAIVANLPAGLPRAGEITLDPTVLGFTFTTMVVAGLAFGILPAVSASKPQLDRVLKEGARSASESPWQHRFRSMLIAAEVALATVLLAGGFLMAKSFLHLIGTPLGMNIENVIVATPAFSPSRYAVGSDRRNFLSALGDRLQVQPNVQSVSLSSIASLSGGLRQPFRLEGQSREQQAQVSYVHGSPELFEVLGIPFRSGRAFLEAEEAVVVTESLADKYFPGTNPLGRRVRGPSLTRVWTIVGVVSDFRRSGLSRNPVPTVISQPGSFARSLLIRTSDDPSSTMAAIRTVAASLDPETVVNLTTLEQSLRESSPVAVPRFRTAILGSFAVIALLLSLVGIYGVTSYSAVQRSQEVGIRRALGWYTSRNHRPDDATGNDARACGGPCRCNRSARTHPADRELPVRHESDGSVRLYCHSCDSGLRRVRGHLASFEKGHHHGSHGRAPARVTHGVSLVIRGKTRNRTAFLRSEKSD